MPSIDLNLRPNHRLRNDTPGDTLYLIRACHPRSKNAISIQVMCERYVPIPYWYC